jgi:hypothetical protein
VDESLFGKSNVLITSVRIKNVPRIKIYSL